jgi:hypothetical protein
MLGCAGQARVYLTNLAICLNWGCSAVLRSSNKAISVQLILMPSAAILLIAIFLLSSVLDETASRNKSNIKNQISKLHIKIQTF